MIESSYRLFGCHTTKVLLLLFQSLNEALEHSNVPVEIVDGFIGTIAVSIPWSALISDSTTMEIHNLELTIQPKQRLDSAGRYSIATNSYIASYQAASTVYRLKNCRPLTL